MLAAGQGYLERVRYLLDHGADVNARSGFSATPVMYGFSHPGIVRLLAGRGADLEGRNQLGETALVTAIKYMGGTRQVLIELGANPFARDPKGRTAIQLIQEEGRGYEVTEVAAWINERARRSAAHR